MQAIRIHTFGEPEVMQLEEVPDPRPAAGQVVVRVHAGVIEAVGPEVEEVAVGDRVCADARGAGRRARQRHTASGYRTRIPPGGGAQSPSCGDGNTGIRQDRVDSLRLCIATAPPGRWQTPLCF